jgi:hypothetical protein
MTMTSIRKILAGAALALAAITTAGALPAAAASTPAASAVWNNTTQTATAGQGLSPGEHLQPDITCHIYSNRFTIYHANCAGGKFTSCIRFGQGSLPFIPRYASNGCTVRVWMYTAAHRHGHALCINPRTADHYLHQNYVWVWISANGSNC